MAYLDHAATTPMLPEAIATLADHLARTGNASSLHASGRAARRVVEESREAVAQAVGARPSEIVFTSGGTEADNLAIKGLYWSRQATDPARTRILVSSVEHHAVLDPAEWLAEHQGAQLEPLPVDAAGRVRPDTLRAAIARDPSSVALVSVMWANNEVGTVQPVAALAEIAASFGVPMHTDAVQAVGQVPVDFAASGVTALTLTGHKLGGPLGVGALVLDRGADLTPVLHGGGQERDVRSGTLDTPAIAAFATATRLAVASQPTYARHVATLRDALVAGVLAAVPGAILNGDPVPEAPGPTGTWNRLPSNAHLTFPGCDSDALLMLLDARGVECSAGSACSTGVPRPSHVLTAMGLSEPLARASLRFTLGHTSTRADVDTLVEVIAPVVERARRAAIATGACPG